MSLPLQFCDFMADTVEYGDRVLEWGFGRGDVCGRSRILDKTKEDDRGEPIEELSCFHNLLPTRKKDAGDHNAVTTILKNFGRVALIDVY